MGNLKRTIALLFNRKGQESLTEKEFVFSASMDLRWFPPKEAQRLLDLGVKRGLLSLKDGRLTPNFEPKEVDIPLDFAPTADVLKEEDDLFQRIVEEIGKVSGMARKEVVSRINAVQARMGIYGEVAALIAGWGMGVDMSGFYPEVEDLIRTRRPNPPAESGRPG
ncbi:MAG: DUF2240 family protein [Thermoplasmata archaeon]